MCIANMMRVQNDTSLTFNSWRKSHVERWIMKAVDWKRKESPLQFSKGEVRDEVGTCASVGGIWYDTTGKVLGT